MQGSKTFRVLLLLLASSWLAGCWSSPAPTPTPIRVEVPVEVPVEVTRVVTQQVTQQFLTAATPEPVVPCAKAQPGESPSVTIGAILPLSSPGAFLAGFSMQTALNIAVSDINDQGGIEHSGVEHGGTEHSGNAKTPVRLVTYDSAGTAERSAEFAERLILLDCAVGIVGLYHNNDAGAVADVAHRYGIPVIIAEAGADEITARGYPEVFRLAPSYSMLAQIPAQWLGEVGDYNGDGTQIAVIIAENSSIASPMLVSMRDDLVGAGIQTELLGIDLPTTDFSSVIARLVAHESLPDTIFISIKGEPALKLQSQLLSAGIGPERSTLIVQNLAGLNSTQFWSDVPNGNGTIVMRMGAWSSTLSERGQEFANKYLQYLGRWPESYAFASYDSISLLADALRVAPSWGGSDLVAALEKANSIQSNGEVTFPVSSLSPLKSGEATYLWHQWQASQVLYLQYTEPNQSADGMSVIWPPAYRSPTLQAAAIPTNP